MKLTHRLVAAATAMFCLAACGSSDDSNSTDDSSSSESSIGSESQVAAPAEPSEGCADRLLNNRQEVDGATLGECVETAMTAARTATFRSEYTDDSVGASGTFQFHGPFAMDLKLDDGNQLIAIDQSSWMYEPDDGGWETGEEDPGAKLAALVWQQYGGPSFIRQWITTTEWKRGKSVTLDGAEADCYSGVPIVMEFEADTILCVDKYDRPMKIESTGSAMGITSTNVSTYSDWGSPVDIKPPA